ncbi:MAG: hypothetical protein CL815_02890 [Coraliomargarita sp.]|nr:hypothetical protein [Coraliomargarita sp.]
MIRISDIAKELGLSRVTVSAILNGRHQKIGISEKTAQRVRSSAKAMGYLPNQNALSMKRGRSMTIGMLSSALSEEWGAKILVGALSAIKNTPYSLRVESVQGAAEERGALERLLGSRIEGLLCCNINPTAEMNDFFKLATERYKVAVVSTNCSFDFDHMRVESDGMGAVASLMEHLVRHGHRRIVHIGGDEGSEVSRERVQAFLSSVQSYQLDPKLCAVYYSHWQIDRARTLARDLLQSAQRPTAVVCANDSIAACTLQIAQELKIKVPQDLSVVGMTNERFCHLTTPQITTVDIPEEQIGRAAVQALLESIEAKENEVSTIVQRLPCTLEVRGSSGVALRNA